MAGDGSWGEGCWFPEDCTGGLQCLIEEDGACKLNCFYDLIFTIALLVTEGFCSLPAWVTGAVVGAAVFVMLALLCFCCCCARLRRRGGRARSEDELVMF